MPSLSELYAPSKNTRTRLTALVWGASGCGKTTLAATASGRKLWILSDPDGTASIGSFDNVLVWDVSSKAPSWAAGFKDTAGTSIKELIKLLEEAEEAGTPFNTIVFDSLTSFGEAALQHGVTTASATPKGRGSTIEDPGFAGYGRKNTYVLQCVRTLLRVTLKYGLHCIFIGHEGAPERDDQGNVIEIPMLLGGNLRGIAPINLSEVWIMTDSNGKREIAVRNRGLRKGGKTRMFRTTSKRVSFTWDFDADKMTGTTVEGLFNAWEASGFTKIDLP